MTASLTARLPISQSGAQEANRLWDQGGDLANAPPSREGRIPTSARPGSMACLTVRFLVSFPAQRQQRYHISFLAQGPWVHGKVLLRIVGAKQPVIPMDPRWVRRCIGDASAMHRRCARRWARRCARRWARRCIPRWARRWVSRWGAGEACRLLLPTSP